MLATFLCVALVGVFGSFFGSEINLPEIGPVLAIATGICILEAPRRKARQEQSAPSVNADSESSNLSA